MRELYATELKSMTSTNGEARPFIDAWIDRHLSPGDGLPVSSSTQENTDGSLTTTLEQIDESSGLRWVSAISLAPPGEPAHISVRIRLGSTGTAGIAPIEYAFGTPAIVRTLLRELEIFDGSTRMYADPGDEVGPPDTSSLVDLLTAGDRSLPVVVVSRKAPSGSASTLDTKTLSRELAGLAHTRVLSSAAASWALTDLLGSELSVWGGGFRVYFAGFSRADDPRRHRLTLPHRVDDTSTRHLRAWLGTLAAAATPEHPAVNQARNERRALATAAADAEDVNQLREYVELLESDNEEANRSAEEYKQRAAELNTALIEKESELDQVKENFLHLQESLARERISETGDNEDGDPTTVAEAMDMCIELAHTTYYRARIDLTDAAVKKGKNFTEYLNPPEMLRACQAVLECGALYHDDRLGGAPGQFFAARGFGYGAKPSPHLKVDNNTSPDQCLRIYWDVDAQSRRWIITSIGAHE